MGIFNFFSKKKQTVAHLGNSAPFVIGLNGKIYTDPSGQATHLALAGGESEVLAAGHWVVTEGRLLVITNESPTYQTSPTQMGKALAHLASIGLDLNGDGKGVSLKTGPDIDATL